ncbi:MAG TPA: lipid A biosynthesis lauroyl acyltransferase [Gammaproteobacteria bacterium]|nr:lipid A biosynthesis lauroyl acyltransferase [Gammaproteobacteria bacterium]
MPLIKAVKIKDYLSPVYWPTWLAIGLMRVVTSLPLQWVERVGSGLGMLIYYLMPARRRVGEVNLKFAFPRADASEITQRNKLCFKNIGVAAFEMGLSWWRDEELLTQCEIEGLDNLKQSQSQGKGVIILTAHFTCLEIGGPVLNHHVPFMVMYKRAHNKLFDAFMRFHRGRLYKSIVDHHKPIAMIKGLKKGYAAWYAPDQDFGGKDSVFVPFFGVDATALTAPARFASMTGAPVVPYLIQRKAQGAGYKLTVLPALDNFPVGDEIADAQRINEVLENLIMKNPDQYLWVHKRSKSRPPGGSKVYS